MFQLIIFQRISWANLILKSFSVNLISGKIVTEKLIPLGVVHLENHVKTKHRYPYVTRRDDLAELTLQEYGENLHIALTSEDSENRRVFRKHRINSVTCFLSS